MVNDFNNKFAKASNYFKDMAKDTAILPKQYYRAGEIINGLPIKSEATKDRIQGSVVSHNYGRAVAILEAQFVH